jgi:hypothetical protein
MLNISFSFVLLMPDNSKPEIFFIILAECAIIPMLYMVVNFGFVDLIVVFILNGHIDLWALSWE